MEIESFAGKMHKIMFKNSAGNKAVLCSLVPAACLACCSLRYRDAAKMCLSENLHFNNFILDFSSKKKIYISKILLYQAHGHKGHKCFLFLIFQW